MAGVGGARAGGRARPGGPHPGVPARAAIEEEEEDDFQIHSEVGATELGAVSGLLNHPIRGQGGRGGTRAPWGPPSPVSRSFLFLEWEKDNFLRNSLPYLPDPVSSTYTSS